MHRRFVQSAPDPPVRRARPEKSPHRCFHTRQLDGVDKPLRAAVQPGDRVGGIWWRLATLDGAGIEELVASPDRANLVVHTRALDRVLQYGYYVIPQYHLGKFWIAYWDKFHHPAITPKYTPGLETWWVDTTAEQAIEAKKKEEGAK